ncbi:MAG: two-component system response regulator NarL [Sedimenticola sp.]
MSEQPPHTLLAIDDHPLFRKGVADLIDMEDSFKLVGEAASGQEGIKLARELNPDIILLDINMKGMDGLETLKAIKALGVDSRVLMLTVSDNEEDVISALRLGADGYLLKDMEPEDILSCLRQAAEGVIVINQRLTQLLAHSLRKDKTVRGSVGYDDLTEREREILALIASGMSNKLIAETLKISQGTVKVHVKHLLKKLGLHSRVEAAVWSLKQR